MSPVRALGVKRAHRVYTLYFTLLARFSVGTFAWFYVLNNDAIFCRAPQILAAMYFSSIVETMFLCCMAENNQGVAARSFFRFTSSDYMHTLLASPNEVWENVSQTGVRILGLCLTSHHTARSQRPVLAFLPDSQRSLCSQSS